MGRYLALGLILAGLTGLCACQRAPEEPASHSAAAVAPDGPLDDPISASDLPPDDAIPAEEEVPEDAAPSPTAPQGPAGHPG